MRILLISNMYPSKDFPSYGVFVKNTEQILKEAGLYVDRIVINKHTNKVLKLVNYILYYSKVIVKCISGKYDLIYVHYASHNAFPVLLAKKLKKKLVIFTNVHGSDVVPESKFSFKLQNYVMKLLAVSDKVIAPSDYYRQLICRKYGLPEYKVQVFPSGGVNSDVFYKIDDREKVCTSMGLDPKIQYIGYAGRIDYKKGWDVLLDAARILRDEGFLNDKRFIIVGHGKQYGQYEQKVNEYHLEDVIVHFNLLPQDRLNEIYNCIELFCFPTMREGESLGLVGLEAMACEVPVVGSKMGGLLDYIKDGQNGFFFEPGDSYMLGKKIKEFFDLPQEKKENMKKEALDTSIRYRVDNIRHTLIDIFISQ